MALAALLTASLWPVVISSAFTPEGSSQGCLMRRPSLSGTGRAARSQGDYQASRVWMGMVLFQEKRAEGGQRPRHQREPQASTGQGDRCWAQPTADGWEVILRTTPPPFGGPCWALCRVGSSHQAGGWPMGRGHVVQDLPALLPPHTYLSTSIFRPSTIVPFSFSRARSASELVSKVTNPKPCE